MQRFYFEQTFKATGDNHRIAKLSTAQAAFNVANRARILVEKISSLPDLGRPQYKLPPISEAPAEAPRKKA